MTPKIKACFDRFDRASEALLSATAKEYPVGALVWVNRGGSLWPGVVFCLSITPKYIRLRHPRTGFVFDGYLPNVRRRNV